jgi:hypothetical protein
MHGGYAHKFVAGTVTPIHRMLAFFMLCFCHSLVTKYSLRYFLFIVG